MKLTVFQPWSEFVMKTVLPIELLSNLIELTDLISKDFEKKTLNDSLAGEIDEEWIIDPPLLKNIKFTSFLFDMIREYLRLIKIQSRPKDTHLDCSIELFEETHPFFKEKNWVIKSAWFNNQRDNEYNPCHNHSGMLSGVIFLRVPEYLPSRKNYYQDGSLNFTSTQTPNDGLFTIPQFSVLPKVGDIFLFPSTLRHQVYPFRTENGKGIRRTMSFNVNDRIMVI